MAYEIVTGKNLYYELEKVTSFKIANKVMRGYRPKFDKNITKKMKNLLSRCWDENINERPTFDEIYKLLTTDEINQYIEDIEDECKQSKSKINKNDQQKEETKNYDISKQNLIPALNFLLGHENEQKFVQSSYMLQVASDEGNSLASYILGLLHESGKDVPKNIEKAKNYYKQSAKQGNSYGYHKLALVYSN